MRADATQPPRSPHPDRLRKSTAGLLRVRPAHSYGQWQTFALWFATTAVGTDIDELHHLQLTPPCQHEQPRQVGTGPRLWPLARSYRTTLSRREPAAGSLNSYDLLSAVRKLGGRFPCPRCRSIRLVMAIGKTMAGLAGCELELRLLSEARGTSSCVTDTCTSAPSSLDAQCDMPTSPNLPADGSKKWACCSASIAPWTLLRECEAGRNPGRRIGSSRSRLMRKPAPSPVLAGAFGKMIVRDWRSGR